MDRGQGTGWTGGVGDRVRIRVSAYIYFGANGPFLTWALRPWLLRFDGAASRGGDAGIGVGDQGTIPIPTIPDGDNFPTKSIPVP